MEEKKQQKNRKKYDVGDDEDIKDGGEGGHETCQTSIFISRSSLQS